VDEATDVAVDGDSVLASARAFNVVDDLSADRLDAVREDRLIVADTESESCGEVTIGAV
jgi:hypothetical protein